MSLGIQNIVTGEHVYVLFVEPKKEIKDLVEKLRTVLGDFFDEKRNYGWFTQNEMVLTSAVIFHNNTAILVISSLYPSKINEIAEKLSEFAEVEVHMAKEDLTIQKPQRTPSP
jgi:hypothetical protein